MNLLTLAGVFALGLGVIDLGGDPTGAYQWHVLLGILAGLICAFTHVSVFTYFMATTKWLHAAADKGALDVARFVGPSLPRKRKAFAAGMGAVVLTFAAMLAGAGADPTARPLWPGEVHLIAAAVAMAANLLAALAQYRLIVEQGRLMDDVLAILNRRPGVEVAAS